MEVDEKRMEGWIGNGLISGCDFRMVGWCWLMLVVMVMVMVITGWGSLVTLKERNRREAMIRLC